MTSVEVEDESIGGDVTRSGYEGEGGSLPDSEEDPRPGPSSIRGDGGTSRFMLTAGSRMTPAQEYFERGGVGPPLLRSRRGMDDCEDFCFRSGTRLLALLVAESILILG